MKQKKENKRKEKNKRIKEQLEEKKIEEFAIKKQEMVDLRKRKEQEKFQEKQRQRQILIDKQIEYLNNLRNKQDEILEKQVKEAEDKRNLELAERQRKFNEFKVIVYYINPYQKQIDEHRQGIMNKKRGDKLRDKQEELQFLELWKEKIKQMEDDEKEENTDIKNRAKNLQNYHKYQIDIKKNKAENDFKNDFENAIKTKLMLQNEQDEFLNYAEGWINEYHQDGKNIIPLLLDLKAYKKKQYTLG